VRGRLDDLIRALGYDVRDDGIAPPAGDEPDRRRRVLERVSSGEITAEQALGLLHR
jgi:hypothetical protein